MSTNMSTKCPSEVFRIAQFCTYFLKKNSGEDPQPPFHLYCLMMCFKKLRIFYTVKMSPTSVWYHHLLKSKKTKRKIAPPPPFLKSWIRH